MQDQIETAIHIAEVPETIFEHEASPIKRQKSLSKEVQRSRSGRSISERLGFGLPARGSGRQRSKSISVEDQLKMLPKSFERYKHVCWLDPSDNFYYHGHDPSLASMYAIKHEGPQLTSTAHGASYSPNKTQTGKSAQTAALPPQTKLSPHNTNNTNNTNNTSNANNTNNNTNNSNSPNFFPNRSSSALSASGVALGVAGAAGGMGSPRLHPAASLPSTSSAALVPADLVQHVAHFEEVPRMRSNDSNDATDATDADDFKNSSFAQDQRKQRGSGVFESLPTTTRSSFVPPADELLAAVEAMDRHNGVRVVGDAVDGMHVPGESLHAQDMKHIDTINEMSEISGMDAIAAKNEEMVGPNASQMSGPRYVASASGTASVVMNAHGTRGAPNAAEIESNAEEVATHAHATSVTPQPAPAVSAVSAKHVAHTNAYNGNEANLASDGTDEHKAHCRKSGSQASIAAHAIVSTLSKDEMHSHQRYQRHGTDKIEGDEKIEHKESEVGRSGTTMGAIGTVHTLDAVQQLDSLSEGQTNITKYGNNKANRDSKLDRGLTLGAEIDQTQKSPHVAAMARGGLSDSPGGGVMSPKGQDKNMMQTAKKIIFFEMKIKRISEIDTTRETFRCRFHYYLTWLATKRESQKYSKWKKVLKQGGSKSADKGYKPDWTPKIQWTNAVEIHEHFQDGRYQIKDSSANGFGQSTWQINQKYLGFDPTRGKWNRVRYEADISFAEELELPAFPFDCQDFTLCLKIEKDGTKACDIVPFPRQGDFCMLDPQFSVLSEWDLENLVCEFGHTDPIKSKASKTYALASIHIKASRRWEAHLGSLIVTFCMFSLGVGTFAQGLEGEELGNRLSFCVTFLLADVATLQLMFQQLPNIPYWTLMDYYIYSCFVFLFLVTIWSCAAGASEILGSGDFWAFVVFACLYFVLHFLFLVLSLKHRAKERQKLTMTDAQLREYFGDNKAARDRRAISCSWNDEFLQANETTYLKYLEAQKSSLPGGASLARLSSVANNCKNWDTTDIAITGHKLERFVKTDSILTSAGQNHAIEGDDSAMHITDEKRRARYSQHLMSVSDASIASPR